MPDLMDQTLHDWEAHCERLVYMQVALDLQRIPVFHILRLPSRIMTAFSHCSVCINPP